MTNGSTETEAAGAVSTAEAMAAEAVGASAGSVGTWAVGPTSYSLTILGALSGSGKHVYAGTVPYAERQRRRERNRVARRSRRANRS